MTLEYLAKLREEPEEDGGSSPDEGAPLKTAGWRGEGAPFMVRTRYTAREFVDGQTLASPGRWLIGQRRHPQSRLWTSISNRYLNFANEHGSPDLLLQFALGKVQQCPFSAIDIADKPNGVVSARVLFDGTNGTAVNTRTRIRDQGAHSF